MSRLDTVGPPAPRSWVETLMPFVAGATEDMVESTLLTVVRDFCREGYIWQETAAPLVLQIGQTRYAIPTPVPNTEVGFILQGIDDQGMFWWPSDRRTVFYVSQTPAVSPSGGLINQTLARVFTSPTVGEVEIPPRYVQDGPDRIQTLKFMVTLVPMTIEVPDWIRRAHASIIQMGVLGTMWRTPNKSWTSTKDGEIRWREYLSRRTAERTRSLDGFVPAGPGWAFPRFGR